MSGKAAGTAIWIGLLIAGTSGCASGTSRPKDGYSAPAVKRVFAAEGLPLEVSGRTGPTLLLVGKQASVNSFTVFLWPKTQNQGEMGVRARRHDRVVFVRNVVVAFSPRAVEAPQVEAAIAHLRGS
jgi:hypothetical protein